MDDYIRRRDAKTVIQNALYDGAGYGEALDVVPAADVRPMRPCDGCPFCVCEKHGVICPSDPDFRCDTRGGDT